MLLIGIREKAEYIDGKSRGLTASRKAEFTKTFGHGMREFFACLSGIREVEVKQASFQLFQ